MVNISLTTEIVIVWIAKLENILRETAWTIFSHACCVQLANTNLKQEMVNVWVVKQVNIRILKDLQIVNYVLRVHIMDQLRLHTSHVARVILANSNKIQALGFVLTVRKVNIPIWQAQKYVTCVQIIQKDCPEV